MDIISDFKAISSMAFFCLGEKNKSLLSFLVGYYIFKYMKNTKPNFLKKLSLAENLPLNVLIKINKKGYKYIVAFKLQTCKSVRV